MRPIHYTPSGYAWCLTFWVTSRLQQLLLQIRTEQPDRIAQPRAWQVFTFHNCEIQDAYSQPWPSTWSCCQLWHHRVRARVWLQMGNQAQQSTRPLQIHSTCGLHHLEFQLHFVWKAPVHAIAVNRMKFCNCPQILGAKQLVLQSKHQTNPQLCQRLNQCGPFITHPPGMHGAWRFG